MSRTSLTSDASRRLVATRTAVAWVAAGAAWLAAGAAGAAGGGHGRWRFDAVEVLWIAADLLLLAGLFGLRALRPHGSSRAGILGLGIAIVGRLVFVASEVVSLALRSDENPLLPLGAVLTATGIVAFGIAVVRRGSWTPAARCGAVAMGVYPFVVMFPILAANGGEPSQPAIAGWGLVAIALGTAVGSTRHTVHDGIRDLEVNAR